MCLAQERAFLTSGRKAGRTSANFPVQNGKQGEVKQVEEANQKAMAEHAGQQSQ